MKHVFRLMMCAAIAAALCSCEKKEFNEPTGDINVPEGYHIQEFSARSEATKTNRDDNGSTVWSPDDRITVFWDSGNCSADCVSGEDSGTATFRAIIPDGTTVIYAAYPEAINAEVSVATEEIEVEIGSEQPGSFSAGNIAVAKADGSTLNFFNVNAFLCFEIPGDDITKVVAESVSGAALAGKQVVSFAGENPALGAQSDPSSAITMTVSGSGRYYMSILPGVQHERGILLKYYKGEDVSGTYYLDKDITTERNKIYAFGEFEPDGNYYATPAGAGNHNGLNWENAFSASELWAAITLDSTKELTKADSTAKAAAINGATVYLAGGDYDFGEDPILFYDNEDPVTLTILGGYNASTGARDITANITNITGNDSHRCMKVSGYMNVSLDGLRFTHGKVSGDNNGGLYCSWSSLSLTMTDCIVSDNVSEGNNGAGMAVNDVGNFEATRVTFARNTGTSAAGLLNLSSKMTLTDCVIEENHATNWCGAVRIRKNTPEATFNNCVVRKNSATNDSGCVVHSEGTATFNDCEFTENTAGGNGGAYTANGNVTITFKGTSFKKNVALYGGAIYTGGSGSSTSSANVAMTLSDNCVISENSATGWCGGLHFKSKGSLTMTDCSFIDNYSAGDSGAFNGDNSAVTFKFTRVTFSGNHADGDNGGVMWISDGTYNFDTCQFLNNYSVAKGGAIYAEKGCKLNVDESIFKGNYGTKATNACRGGAICLEGKPRLRAFRDSFIGNHAGYGGAVYCIDKKVSGSNTYPNVYIDECSFDANYVSYRWGPVFASDGVTNMMFNNCSMRNNYTSSTAADDQKDLKPSWICIDDVKGTASISNCSIIGDTQYSADGVSFTPLTNNTGLIAVWGSQVNYFTNNIIVPKTAGIAAVISDESTAKADLYYTHYSNLISIGDFTNTGGNTAGLTAADIDGLAWTNDGGEFSWWQWSGTISGTAPAMGTKADIRTTRLEDGGIWVDDFKSWLGGDANKDQRRVDRGEGTWWPGAYQPQ